jgi:von Willebrand factor type A domain
VNNVLFSWINFGEVKMVGYLTSREFWKSLESGGDLWMPHDYDIEESEEREDSPRTVAQTSTIGPTSLITFRETEHGRLRRKQRGIDKKDLQSAIRYGKARRGRPRRNGNTTTVYTYKEIVYVVDNVTKEEVTCYAVPLTLDRVALDPASLSEHEVHNKLVKVDSDCWTSNTVIVVDMSGSMRNSDVWGARNRLASVWIAVALDFVANKLERGEAKPTDVISILTLSESPTVILEEVPFTWVVYNEIVDIYNNSTYKPSGHGPFLPALELAENMMSRCNNDGCAQSIIFLSDGVPSDRVLKGYQSDKEIVAKVGELASTYGRRLTFTAVGIGDHQGFPTLRRMVDEAADYGVAAQLMLPSLSSESIGVAFTSTVTSTISCQNELMKRQVKRVRRESKAKARERVLTVNDEGYWIYPKHRIDRKIYTEIGRELQSVSLKDSLAEFVAMAKAPFGEGAERLVYRFYEVAKDRTSHGCKRKQICHGKRQKRSRWARARAIQIREVILSLTAACS